MTEPMISVPREGLRALFDLAVGSMDFGSGFWVDEDVHAVRAIAELLGVDPMEATPAPFRRQWPHPFVTGAGRWIDPTRCRWCEKGEDDEIHAKEVAP